MSPLSAKRLIQIPSPRQTVTPDSDAGSKTPISRPRANHPPVQIISDEEEDEDELPPLPPPLRVIDSWNSSDSSSETDEIEVLKKKARGVLPGSFFTVHRKNVPFRSNVARH